MILNAQQVYDKLVNEDKITELQGHIRFFFGDVDIVARQKDVVGNIIPPSENSRYNRGTKDTCG